MESRNVSHADNIAEGGRPLKRGATAIINASADDDDIFNESDAKRRRKEEEPKKPGDEEESVSFFSEDEDVPKSKHTLDSDEEDEDKYERLDMKKVDGQEDSTIDYDGDTKITAFNMKEDLEEGHFDATGNFIFDKKEKDDNDAWLDGIDWSRVKKKAGKEWQGEGEGKDEEMGDDLPPPVLNDVRRKEIFSKLATILQPGQTITKALQELQKNKKKSLSAADERKARWAAKKAGKEYVADDGGSTMTELSTLGDELLSAGHMDAYEWSHEKVCHLLGRLTSSGAGPSIDMFSDEPEAGSSTGASKGADDAKFEDAELMWEWKTDGDSTDVLGPFSSLQMAEKQAKDELPAKAVARKVGSSGFNPVIRIDFDIYV